ncbi:MAG: SDR family oxidoreductase [Candidatus Ancillula sp.]|jgi:NAD(P)-dependent dehydrogenase (short-subunit alcohol dehydrogenase family)|nr:SDR family oxidoreductase [Candidatus Ancillula sp.]
MGKVEEKISGKLVGKLIGKVAIVTGAASGIGRATAKLFASEGAKVVVSDMNLEGAEKVVEEINAFAYAKNVEGSVDKNAVAIATQTNVAKLDDIKTLYQTALEKFGRIDITVNNAGIMDGMQPVGKLTDELWDKVIAVNLNSVFYSMREAVQIFLKQKKDDDGIKGVIVNIASIGGLFGGRAGAAYTASKHGVVGLTKNTAFEYEKRHIRCNAIAPGGVMTNVQKSMFSAGIDARGMMAMQKGMKLDPRLGKPEEVAKVALFLASDDSSFVNGQILTADAGWTSY